MRWWWLWLFLLVGCTSTLPVDNHRQSPTSELSGIRPTQNTQIPPTMTPPPTSTPAPSPTATPPPCANIKTGPITYLALGDSYTIGEAVAPAQSWPFQLVDILRDQRAEVEDPTILATTGWTSGELLSRLDRVTFLRPEYDLVSLLIGVNNQYRGRDPEEFRQELIVLLERAVALAGRDPQRVLVLSIPDYSVTPFAASRDPEDIALKLAVFNEIVRTEATKAGARYIDITPISLRAATQQELLAEDGLHPSGEMYALWADLVFPVACAALTLSA